MKKTFLDNLKRLLCSGLFCAGVNYSADSSIIRKHDLEYHVRQTAEQFLANEGFGPFYIPARLLSDYEQKLQTARQELLKRINQQGGLYLDASDVQATISRTMRPFADNLRNIIHDYQLEAVLINAIQSYLATKGLTQDDIPARDVAEYINRSAIVMDKLKTIMRNDRRSYVRVFEVEKEIENALKLFVSRIANAQSQSYNQNSYSSNQNVVTSFDWFDQFFNTSTQPKPSIVTTTPGTTANASKIMDYDLEQSVTNAAYSILRTYNIDPNKIPARAISEYSAKVQKSLQILKNLMIRSGRTYVWKDELETTMLQEMQSVVDKINFIGESCAICLDDYTIGQRIGIVSCSHHFHSDCIYTWFKQQKTCPMCRAQNVIVAQIETMK